MSESRSTSPPTRRGAAFRRSESSPPRRIATAIVVGMLLTATASACSVPVFRYALEHWHADPYVAIVYHRGELTATQQALVESLNPKGDTGKAVANIAVQTVDLDAEPGEAMLALWQPHEAESLPYVLLQTPPKLGPSQTAWHGELTADNIVLLFESPVRDELRRRLLEGDSVVWLLLESGNQAEDDAAFTLLRDELARLEKTIELPAIDKDDLADLSVDPTALKIAFSAIRVSREDARERALIEQLLRVEVDLQDEAYVHQTMAFPVFGRGRALYALVGEGITPETIEDANRFLAGACQCTVKAQNPGVDLLMAVDWDQYVTPALPYDDSEPVLAGLTSFARDDDDPQLPATTGNLTTPGVDDVAQVDRPAPAPQDDDFAAQVELIEDWNGLNGKDRQADVQSRLVADGVQSTQELTINITLLLGLVVAGVVLATSVILFKSR